MIKVKQWLTSDYAALAAICFVVIVYQLALTRLLSVVSWYHYTFLTLALVMLGLGVPGIWFALSRNPFRFLPYFLLFAALSLVASDLFILHGAHLITDYFFYILSIILAILIPMLCLGGCVCLYLMKAQDKQFGRMYAADLTGAFAGAALIIPLIHLIPIPLMIALLSSVVLLVLIFNVRRYAKTASVLLIVLAALAMSDGVFQLRHTKYNEIQKGLIYEKWTPTTRITVFNRIFWRPNPDAGFFWGPGSRAHFVKKEQYWVEQDATAGTPITKFDGHTIAGFDYLLDDVTNAAYLLRQAHSAAIIGGGGGRDILSALVAGIKDVNAIELNPGMVATVSGPFKEFSGDIYHHPSVHTVISEGRSYLTRTGKQYDLIPNFFD